MEQQLVGGNTADVPDGLLVDIDCSVSGCTDDFALNFNPDANVNNGTCEYGPESDCSCSGCEADFCFGDEYCGSSNPNFGVDGDGEIYCDWLDEWPMCWDPSCEQADECDGEYDDCGVCDGPAIAGSGDINTDGDLNINDIVMMGSASQDLKVAADQLPVTPPSVSCIYI